ncbi:hypothetical protein LTR10_018024 [Elasticomyces elasticus]|uniref:Cell wall proline rich protein n=1 Tax=Exophiala sideris TaxID=1016849 RepID=A0ABR0JR92_9EURO|nr:hypothetical protein LTR10_018024 [Elasticomyces elasticus]KAK5039572.1 hypothetical protein LTS07_000066 [Exophiala sideris]KAK5041124.1 hypothetical protein LTR13_002598 [Exophiala sideris]KAK5067949.1 hypothetical protein LTR69_000066 [Exophiala sideris]KAK5187251.1 hypothetical protein LTR44_000066 [Eurotiomycetes sp. CCFEE 6388]
MTSISLPPSVPVLSPFDSTPSTPPRSPAHHRRRTSCNPNASPLPAFKFNPGADENTARIGGMDLGNQNSSAMAAMEARRRSTRTALPDFKFNPGADLPTERSPSPTHPVLQEMAMNQQRAVRSARPAPLPAFAFAPNAPAAQRSASPTKSNFDDVQPPPRNGHRRGVSEFVGGGNNGPQMVSTSPEKPEYRPPPPVTAASRGHAHRRSQAVSISDIDTSELIKANALSKARAGSSPTTPSDGALAFSFPRASPQMRQSMSNIVRTPPSSPRRRGSAPGVRPRVGFSEHVDVIPRPLSLISSETEGSTSTVRGCHSLSGSINSIASPTPRPGLVVTSSNDVFVSPERPQTADALSTLSPTMTSEDQALSIINLPKRPLSASGSPGNFSSGSPPTKKKHFWFTHSNNGSPLSTPKAEQSDPMDISLSVGLHQVPKVPVEQKPIETPTSKPNLSKKRKYHTWTSGIFSRKSDKRPVKAKEEVPALPSLVRRPSDRLNEVFDTDDTVVIRDPSPISTRVRAPVPNLTLLETRACNSPKEQITSPVLDLDAALGPFGSEEKLGLDSNMKSMRIAKLHSSERRGSADAFGTAHRRTESAPTMPAVNRNTFSIHRFGSNTSLTEDVFDEQEEDNFLAGKNYDDLQFEKKAATVTDTNMVLTNPEQLASDGLGLSLNRRQDDGVIIADLDEDVARAGVRSSSSTIEAPTFQNLESQKPAMSSPMVFAYPAPQSHYASSTDGRTTSASMMSSPDVDHISFETLSRPSRFLNEPSPDFVLRASNDDLPSLSDSISSAALPRFSSSAGTRSSTEQRSHSMIDPSTSRSNNQQAWKRASLASLNRLIPGSSNGSKLKFETVPDATVLEEKSKKKTNRISRLMQFWRSKEKTEK